MNRFRSWCSLLLLIPILAGCEAKPMVPEPTSSPKAQATPVPEQPDRHINLLESATSKSNSLSCYGYDLVKLTQKVRVEETPGLTEVSYAVLKKHGKKLAEFDGVYSGFGNATDFGLFTFLGGEAKQLFVSQTIPRGGRHWVVSLSPDFRIIYDSGDWGVGRDDFTVLDVDGDGIFEISQEVTAFYGFENMSSSETPLPAIIFKYNKRERKYLPANKMFRDFALEAIELQMENLHRGERHLSSVLDIVLRYIYVGEDQEAWAFFEREYTRADKTAMKAKILTVLEDEAVYKYFHRKPQPNNSFNRSAKSIAFMREAWL